MQGRGHDPFTRPDLPQHGERVVARVDDLGRAGLRVFWEDGRTANARRHLSRVCGVLGGV